MEENKYWKSDYLKMILEKFDKIIFVEPDSEKQEFWKSLGAYNPEINLKYADGKVDRVGLSTKIRNFLEDMVQELKFLEQMLLCIDDYGEKFEMNYRENDENTIKYYKFVKRHYQKYASIDLEFQEVYGGVIAYFDIDGYELNKIYERLSFEDDSIGSQPISIITNYDNSNNYNGDRSPIYLGDNGTQNINYSIEKLDDDLITLIKNNKEKLMNNGFTEEEVEEVCGNTTREKLSAFMTKTLTLGNIADAMAIAQGIAMVLQQQ